MKGNQQPPTKKTVPAKTSTKRTKAQPQAPVIVKKNTKKKVVKKKEPKPPGRKPWVPDYEKIENWATQGLLDKEIAALCGIAAAVFCDKKNELPKLQEILDHGRAKGIAACSQKLLSLALSGSERSLHFYLERIGKRHKTLNLETPKKPVHEMTEVELLAILNGEPLDNEM